MMNELMMMFVGMFVGIVEYVKALTFSQIGLILTIVIPFLAQANGLLGFFERFTEKKFAFKRKEKEKKDKKETSIDELEPINNVAEILALISYQNIASIEKMEVIFITKEDKKFPINVEGISSMMLEMNFAYIEQAKHIEYIRLEGVLFNNFDLVDKIEIGIK